MAVKANKWLLDNGHITAVTRGRMRLENIALLNRAVADGVQFSDFPKGTVNVLLEATDDAPAQLTYKREDGYGSTGEVVDIAPYLYNHDTHAAYEDVESGRGKRRSLKEVCFNCGVSLVQDTCGAPMVVARNGQGYVPVTIVPERSEPHKGFVW